MRHKRITGIFENGFKFPCFASDFCFIHLLTVNLHLIDEYLQLVMCLLDVTFQLQLCQCLRSNGYFFWTM